MSRNPLIKRRRRCGRVECQECCGTNATPIKCTVSAVSNNTQPAASDPGSTQRPELNWVGSWSKKLVFGGAQATPAARQCHKHCCHLASGWWGQPGRRVIKRQEPLVRDLCGIWPTLVLYQGVLCRRWERGEQGETLQLVVPSTLRDTIFQQLHSSHTGGHLGTRRSVAKIRDRFFWPRSKADIERWCRECNACAQVRSGPQHRAALQQEPGGSRFQRVAIDIMGELPETSNGNKYVLVLCDYFTKWTQAFALRDQTAYTVADTLMTQCFNVWVAWSHPFRSGPELWIWPVQRAMSTAGHRKDKNHSLPSSIWWDGRKVQQNMPADAQGIHQREQGWLGWPSSLPHDGLP